MKKKWIVWAAVLTAAALTGCVPGSLTKLAEEVIRAGAGTTSQSSEAKKETEKETETDAAENKAETTAALTVEQQIQKAFEAYAEQNKLVFLDPKTQLDFSYLYERKQPANDASYWFACPTQAELSDCLLSTYQKDLDHDGVPELLALSVKGSRESGAGENHLYLDVFSWDGSSLNHAGSVYFSDCFHGVNTEQYLIGIKNVGARSLIYAGSSDLVYTWADGSSPTIRLYGYDGQTVNSLWEVSEGGSDWSWMDGWRDKLRSYGFDVFGTGQYGNWMPYQMAGESSFDVLLYADCDTVLNEQEAFSQGGNEGTQQYILNRGVIKGSIFGTSSAQTLAQIIANGQSTSVSLADTGVVVSGSGTPETAAYGVGDKSQAISSGGYSNNTVNIPQTQPAPTQPVPTQPAVSPNYGNSAYTNGDSGDILPQSSTQYITRSDLYGLSKAQLRIARNEIYARHGRIFDSKELADYFNSKSWYRGTVDKAHFSDDNMLSKLERENIKVIQSME